MVERIKPESLRVECQECGGFGHVVLKTPTHYPTVHYTHVEERKLVCAYCSGRGSHKPRRPIR